MVANSTVTTMAIGTSSGSNITTKVSKFGESGGKKLYSIPKGFGNQTDVAVTGADDWEIVFDVHLSSGSLFEIYDDEDIYKEIIINFCEVGSSSPVEILRYTYGSAIPKSMNGDMGADGYFKGTLTYTVPYYDSVGSKNRLVEYGDGLT